MIPRRAPSGRRQRAPGTPPESLPETLRFVVKDNAVKQPAWWLVDPDGVVLAWSGHTFATLAHADHAAHDFRVDGHSCRFRLERSAYGRWRWVAWRAGEVRVAVSSVWSADRATARESLEQMLPLLALAIGP